VHIDYYSSNYLWPGVNISWFVYCRVSPSKKQEQQVCMTCAMCVI